jgi:hypothetical protein
MGVKNGAQPCNPSCNLWVTKTNLLPVRISQTFTKFSDRFHTKSSSSASLWAIQRHMCSMGEFPGRPLHRPSTSSQSLWMMALNSRRMLGCRAPRERPSIFYLHFDALTRTIRPLTLLLMRLVFYKGCLIRHIQRLTRYQQNKTSCNAGYRQSAPISGVRL